MSEIFVPKPMAEIVAGMVEHVRESTLRVTDFNVGSVLRALFEAHAVELDSYYQSVYLGLMRAIPTAIYLGFGFERRPAIAATGLVVFSRDSGNASQTVVAGTRLLSVDGTTYLLDDDVTLNTGQLSASGIATAEIPGGSGNTDPGPMISPLLATTLTATTTGFLGGADAETDEQRAERFAQFILAISRGTRAAIEYAATIPAITHPLTGAISERVQRATVDETPGHLDLYVWNGSYGASASLIAQVQSLIDGARDPATDQWIGGYRPAGMRIDVQALVATPVAMSLEVRRDIAADPTAIQSALGGTLDRALRQARPRSVVRILDLVNAALLADGVLSVIMREPLEAITVPANALLVLGELEVTWAV